MKPWHVIVMVGIVLLLFGARRLPDLAKSVGQSMKIFKNEVKELTEDSDASRPAQPVAPAQPAAPVQQGSLPQPAPAPAPGLLYERDPRVAPGTDPVASPKDDATPPS